VIPLAGFGIVLATAFVVAATLACLTAFAWS